MTKLKFLLALHERLSGLPQDDVEERLNFYSEMIEDRMEEGLPEADAVAAVGTVEEIAAQIAADIPAQIVPAEKPKQKKKGRAWAVLLLVLGSPLWLSLLIAAFAVIFSVYVSLWSVILSLWAVFVSLAVCAIGGIAAGFVLPCIGHGLTGVTFLGGGFICAGLAIFFFYGCKWTTKGIRLLSKKMDLGIKNCFVKKESA